MLIDVAGGLGHEAAAVKKRYPELPARFVVQDLPQVTSETKLDGIEEITHDFFTSQPLQRDRA
jgi:O-methyltransferase domain